MLRTALALLAVLLLPAAALAAPISMNPGSVSIDTVVGKGNPFTVSFDGGDTSDNVLNFTAHGGGSPSFLPSTALAAIVFDDAGILDAGDSTGGLFSPGNVVRGIAVPGSSVAAALLVDAGRPDSESFWIQLDRAPTTATFYSLSLGRLGAVHDLSSVLGNAISRQRVAFRTGGASSMPEPSAALLFAVGFLIVHRALRHHA